MKRSMLTFLLSMCLLLIFGTVASASDIMPLWNSTEECNPYLYFTGNTAHCNLDVIAVSGSDKITATITLQRENSRGNYTNVKSWPGLSGTGTLHFSETYTVSNSGNYRLKAEVEVTGAGGSDNITVYSS